MKYIITESQYSGLINLIKKQEDKLSFLKSNMTEAILSDLTDFFRSKFQGRFGNYSYMQYPAFFIYPDKLTSELRKYNRSEPALVILYHIKKSTGKVEISIFGILLYTPYAFLHYEYVHRQYGKFFSNS